MKERYDYIICGAGLAGLSLATRLAAPSFYDKKVLIVDRDAKQTNDRTWSFWIDKKDDRFAEIYHKTWDKLAFHAPHFTRIFDADPFQYHTIRGIDFYNHSLAIIEAAPHIDMLIGDVQDVSNDAQGVSVTVEGRRYYADYAFDSIVRSYPEDARLFVWQHFMGWEIDTDEAVFDEEVATYMDFRIDQEDDFRFVYVLPFSKNRALIEITFFTKDICTEAEYVAILKKYIAQYFPNANYKVTEKELGKIPMTTAPFGKRIGNIIPIGTKNATVKPSSGYAFVRIQQEADQLIQSISKGKPEVVKHKPKYISYDKTLLNVLVTKKEGGRDIFTTMFRDSNPVNVLKFLNEDTSLIEEAQFFKTLPIWSFTKAWIEENIIERMKTR